MMKSLFLTAVLLISFTYGRTQTYTYTHTRDVHAYSDGFGIPFAKTVAKTGTIDITTTAIIIDGVRYLPQAEEGAFKSRGGKQAVIQYLYQGDDLRGVLVKRGVLVREYYFINPTDCAACHTATASR